MLAVSLIAAAAPMNDFEFAENVYRDITPLLGSEGEKLDLAAIMAVMYALELREADHQQLRYALEESRDKLSDLAATFTTIADAVFLCRSGEFERARRLFRIAKLRADSSRSFQAAAIESQMVLEAAVTTGCRSAGEKIRAFLDRYGISGQRLVATMGLIIDFMGGAWNDVLATAQEAREEWGASGSSADFLSVKLAIHALRRQTSNEYPLAHKVMLDELQAGRWQSGALIGSWLLAARGSRDSTEVRRVLDALGRAAGGALAWSLTFGATALLGVGLYADRWHDETALEWVSARAEPRDRTPWYRANYLLAQGIVRGRKDAKEARVLLHEAEGLFRSLDAAALAAIAAERAETASDKDLGLLRELAIPLSIKRSAKRGATNERGAREVLSKRELEIAELVASGSSNRDIASALFLSERTVEAHISNIFRKVDVNSRAQLTRWFVLRM